MQFRGAYRRIIGSKHIAELQLSPSTNSIPQNDEDVSVFETRFAPLQQTTLLRGNVVNYFGGFVIKKVLSKLSCDQCADHLMAQGDCQHELLIDLRDNGGLMRPSQPVLKLLCAVENVVRQLDNRRLSCKRLRDKITQTVMNEIVSTANLPFPDDHECGMNSHSFQLTRSVINTYLKVRLHHLSKSLTMREQGEKIRSKLNKTILFAHQ